jgi:hypothetical protein
MRYITPRPRNKKKFGVQAPTTPQPESIGSNKGKRIFFILYKNAYYSRMNP